MNIVIVGAGQVGYTLAEKLTAYGHDITVIDDSSENLQHIANNLDVIKSLKRAITIPTRMSFPASATNFPSNVFILNSPLFIL